MIIQSCRAHARVAFLPLDPKGIKTKAMRISYPSSHSTKPNPLALLYRPSAQSLLLCIQEEQIN
jgi:hypothetical protein